MRRDGRGYIAPPMTTERLARAYLRDLKAGGPAAAGKRALEVLKRERRHLRYRFNLRRLYLPLERVPIDRPIFLLGVQGGGGTIISRCLQRHPQTVYASGYSDFWAARNEIHNCPHLVDLPEPLVHRSHHFGTADGRVEPHPRFGTQRSWLYATDELLPRYAKTAQDADGETALAFRGVLQKIILAYAHDPLRSRLVDQSQLYTIQVPYLARLLEGTTPHFVLIARDPYATCARAVDKEYTKQRGSFLEHDRPARIACAVEHWTNSYRLALEAARDVPMLTVRYEDFLDDPAAVVGRICAFAGLEFRPELVPAPGQIVPPGSVEPEKWYPLKRGENERYLAQLDPALVQALEAHGRDIIEKLGYSRPTTAGC